MWKTDSLHGDSPFTEQPGQCGEEGDYIQVKIFQRDAKCFRMYDSHARCQKTFWQQKTLQLCPDLASCSSGLASGFVLIGNWFGYMLAGMGCLKNTAILEINAILPFTHNRSGLQMDQSKRNRNKSFDNLITGWASCQHSALTWRWKALWMTGRARKYKMQK